MSTLGLSCWRGVEARECDAVFNIEGEHSPAGYDALDDAAGRAGWVMGHFDGQAHYACPRCAVTLFDPFILQGNRLQKEDRK